MIRIQTNMVGNISVVCAQHGVVMEYTFWTYEELVATVEKHLAERH